MKSLTEYCWFDVPDRRGFVNVTDIVEGLVKKSGVQEGLCLVNSKHKSNCLPIPAKWGGVGAQGIA
jgi:thiamine phosphate synthase YjbQ (UPF0047 family)